jgi:hypothetical protein
VAAARARSDGGPGGRGVDAIDAYLAELGRRLGRDPLLRRRVLVEVEDHLREAARRDGVEAALERFGSPDLVAQGFAAERAASAAVWATAAVAAAAGGFLVAYLVGENALPPAPWPTEAATPAALRWKLAGLQIAYAVGLASAVVAVVAAWRGAARLALLVGTAATSAVASAVVLAVVEALQRAALYEELGVSGRPSELSLALAAAALVSLTALAGAGVVWAGRVARTAQRASRS